MTVGLIISVLLPSYPETCHFLNQADRVLAVARGQDGYDQESLVSSGLKKITQAPKFRFNYPHFLDAIKELRTWGLALAWLCVHMIMDILIISAPETAATAFKMNHFILHNSTQEQLQAAIEDYADSTFSLTFLATVPFLMGGIAACVVGYRSDDKGERGWHAAVSLLVSSIGFFILSLVSPLESGGPIRYFLGLIPACIGLYAAAPCILAYGMDKALENTYRATTAVLLVTPGYAFGLLVAGHDGLFRKQDAPTYSVAHGVCSLLALTAALVLIGLRWYTQQEEESGWGRAPGLRRLMNDQDEAKAWDIELTAVDFLKTSRPIDSEWDE